jgi:MFS family permease
MLKKLLPTAPAFSYTNYRWWTVTNAMGPLERGTQQGILAFYVLEVTGSASLMAVSVALQGVSALFMLPAGVLADRFDRKLLLIGSLVLAAVVTIGFCVLIALGIESYALILTFVTLSGILTSGQMPISRAILPMTVPREHLLNGISLGTITQSLPRVLGPGIAALLYDLFGPEAAFLVGAIVLLFGALAVLPLQLGEIDQSDGSENETLSVDRSFLSDMSEVVYFLRSNPVLLTIMALMCVAGLFMVGPVNYGSPIIFREIHQTSAGSLGVAWAMLSLGMVISSLFITRVKDMPNKGGFFATAILGGGFCVAAMALSPTAEIVIFFFFIWGCGGGFFMNMSQALLQMRTPDKFMGRVMSLSSLAMLGLMPIGVAQVALIDNGLGFGTQPALVISGMICSSAALVALLAHREFRQAK